MEKTAIAAAKKRLLRRGRALIRSAAGAARDIMGGLTEAEREELGHIHGALERMERGRFGRCEACGHGIEAARLESVPWLTTCTSCALPHARV